VLLQAGQLLSAAGTQSASLAYPLLVLAVTHSPARAGAVGFAAILPYPLLGLFAGVFADRWNRKRLMIAADAIRVLAISGLATAILTHRVAFWQIVVAALVEGAGAVVFGLGEAGAVRSVVAPSQLAAATAAQTGRRSAVRLFGPPLGGVLFGLGRAVPFLADAVSYVFSTGSLLAIRTPFQEQRERERGRLRPQLAEGFRFLWSRPFLRTSSLVFALSGFLILASQLLVIVLGKRQGLSGGEVGLLIGGLSAATLAGSFASSRVRRLLGVRAILLCELWSSVVIAVFIARPSVFVLAAALLPQAFVIPASDSVVVGYRIAVTPDRLLGRVSGITIALAATTLPFGPLSAGLLLDHFSAKTTVAVFACAGLGVALWGTLSPPLRNAPSMHEIEPPPPLES
jgi:MFS family permease